MANKQLPYVAWMGGIATYMAFKTNSPLLLPSLHLACIGLLVGQRKTHRSEKELFILSAHRRFSYRGDYRELMLGFDFPGLHKCNP